MTIRGVVCTGNAHKVEELRDLLGDAQLQQLPPEVTLPPETGDSFEANARIKALGAITAGLELEDGWAIADDSGICVDALDGAPGVYSARYAGEDASDADNVERMLQQLARFTDPAQRTAHFVCVLVAARADGTVHVAEGRVDGQIACAPAGTDGFGYDPIFIPDGYDQTFAQLGASVKSQLSHRARAAELLRDLIHSPG